MAQGAAFVGGDLNWVQNLEKKDLKKLIMDIAGMDEVFQNAQRDLMKSMDVSCPSDEEVCRVARLQLSVNGSDWKYQFIPLEQVPEGIESAQIDDLLIKQAISANVESTLRAARQLEVMQHLGSALFAQHRIVVDVDYYRTRPKNSVGFHKDSTGHTLFVNLTFDNSVQGIATEYILDKVGVEKLEANLPQCFRNLLQLVRTKITTGDKIMRDNIKGGGLLPICGRVSSIDALIFHSTPLLSNRGDAELIIDFSEVLDGAVSDWDAVKQEIKAYLERAIEDEKTAIIDAETLAQSQEAVNMALALIGDRTGVVSGKELKELLSIRHLDVGLTQTESGTSLHDLRLNEENETVKRERRMSRELKKDDVKTAISNQQTQDRRFIRTWVMAVPR